MSFHPETENYKYWTTEDSLKLESLVLPGTLSFKDIGVIMNRTASSCQKRSVVLGLSNNYIRKLYSVNEDFWKNPNPINSYWAGFSAADCNIELRAGGHYSYRLELQVGDKAHLEKFKSDIDFTGPIHDYSRPNLNCFTSKIQINSDIWAEDLKNNFGIIPKKTKTIMPPNASDELLFHWLVGYTDGDGSICISKDSTIYISYVSCSGLLINWIKEYFDKFGSKLSNKAINVKNYDNKYYTFKMGGLKAAQFIDKVNNSGVYCLSRKWKNPIILDKIAAYKSQYPHLFLQTTSNPL